MTYLKASLTLLLLLFSPLLGAQTLYKSTGPNGEVIYSAKPLTGTRIERTLEYTPGPSNPLPDYVLRFKGEIMKKHGQKSAQGALDQNQVHLFTTSWCGYCRRAKAYLAKKQVAYTEHDVETPAGMAVLAQIDGAGHGVPVLVWHGQKLYGFSEPSYEALFSAAP